MDVVVDKARVIGQCQHAILTTLAALLVAAAFRKPALFVMILSANWMASIFLFAAGPIARWRIVASVATSAVVMSLFYVFLFGKYLP